MGTVIHTKDGRTLMKGPDGRWMSAGKATKEKTFKEAADSYAKRPTSEMDWNALNDYIEKNGLRKDYNIMMNKRPGGQEYTKQLRVMRDLVDDHRAREAAKAEKKPFRRGHAINQKTPRTVNKAEKKSTSLIDIRNTERGRQLIDQLEEAEEEMRGRGLKDGDQNTWVYQKESAVEALKKEFGYDWDKPAKKSVPKNQVEVSDSHYVYSSGRRPSGNGNWAFYIGSSEEPIFFSGKYSEAKKKAIAEAAKRGVKKITLGS